MKRLLLTLVLFLSFLVFNAQNSGIFDAYVITETTNGGLIYNHLVPNNGFNGAFLGDFECDENLLIKGGQVKTFKCGPDDIFNGILSYRIYVTGENEPDFIDVNLPFSSEVDINCGGKDQIWEQNGLNINIIDGLPVGNYTFEVYARSDFNFGTHFWSNNGANYKATFNVVDNIAPTITCPGNITVSNDPGACGAVVEFEVTATDNCSSSGAIIPLATQTTTLNQVSGFTHMGVAYNPDLDLYYSVSGGSPAAPIQTFDGNGILLLTSQNSGHDWRGIWWNPNENQLEGNPCSSCQSNGIRVNTLNANGYAISSGTNLFGTNQPNFQSQGDYDYINDEIIYYNNGQVYRVDHSNNSNLPAITLDLASAGTNTNNINSLIGFSGIAGAEYMIYDVVSDSVLFFDTSGSYQGLSELPAGIPNIGTYWNLGFSNGQVWLYSNGKWFGYSVAIPGGLGLATNSIASGSFFPVGTTTVTSSITDESGNSATCSFDITVEDNEAPNVSNIGGLLPGSSIVDNADQELILSWIPANLQYEANLLFTKTIDGSSSQAFHANSDGIPNTLIVVKTTNGFIFGGYNEGSWNTSSGYQQNLTNNFLFSVTNNTKHDNPGQIYGNSYSTYNSSNYGPTFGGGHDLYINNQLSGGYSNLGYSYDCVTNTPGSQDCQDNLAGSFNSWQIEELEVWELKSSGSPVNNGGGTLEDIIAECEVLSIDAPVVSDNCVGDVTGVTETNFPITASGTTEVIWTFDDGNGNISSLTQNVIIEDNEDPTITHNGDKNVSTDLDTCGALISVSASTEDNCSVGAAIGVRSDGLALNALYPVGSTTVTWNVSDASGNPAVEVTQTVTVTDNQNPNAIAKDITIQLDASGAASIAAGDVDNGSNDNCGNITLSIDQTNFDCDDIDTSGYAAAFTSGPDFIDMGNSTELKVSNAISIEAWIYPTGPGSLNTAGGIIVNKEGEYEIARFSDGTIQWAIANSNPGWIFINTGAVAPLNQWTHVAFTYNGSTARTFINGNLVHSISASGIINDVYPPDNNFRIGGRIPQQNQYFHGNIDEVRIWNTALSDTQVASQYNTTIVAPQTGLIGYWSLDEGTGNTTVDKSGNSNNGTFNDQTSWSSPGAISTGNTKTVTLTVTDTNNNSSSATATVTIVDIINPTITCPGDIIGVLATSASGAIASWDDPVSDDNCAVSSTTIVSSPTANLASGSTFPIGTTTVTYEVTDAANNKAECSFDVTVVGVTPDIVCPANIIVENDAGQCGAIVTFAATETAGIPASTITYSHPSGSEFPVGTTIVTATATNAVGTSECTFEITVNDTEDPIIVCAADVSENNDPGFCSADLNITAPTFSDNCEQTNSGATDNALNFNGSSNRLLIDNPSNFNLGTATGFTFQATVKTTKATATIFSNMELSSLPLGYQIWIINGDLLLELYGTPNITTSGLDLNDGQCHHIAIVVDKLAANAKLYVDGALALNVNNPGYANNLDNSAPVYLGQERTQNPSLRYLGDLDEVAFFNVARTDSDILASSQTQLSGSETGLVSYWKLDEGAANGNNGGIISATDSSGGNNGTLIGFGLSGSTSNWVNSSCQLAAIPSNSLTLINDFNNTDDASGIYPVGTTTVTWTATDAAGNTATCEQIVTVIDSEVPTITCLSDITDVVATSASGAVVNYTAPVGTDNCTGVNTALTAGFASGSTFPIGTSTVTYEVTDAANNKAQCSFNVTVVGVSPDIECPANITVENDAGLCGAIVTFAATETVGIPASTISYSHASGSEFPVGTTTVTATSTNAVGTSQCTFTVTVNDTQNPTIACAADVEINNTPGQCYGEVVLTPPTASDNCSAPGNALNFDGVNDHIIVSNPNDFNLTATDDFTIQGLIKTTRDKATIFSKMTVGSPFGFQFWVWDGKLALEWGDGGISFIFSNTIVNDGQYHHVAAVVSRSSSNLKLYVDGVLEADVTNARYTSEINNSASVFIGQERSLNPNLRWQGDIDELAFFKSARTSSQILASTTSQLTGNEPNIVSYWKFNSGISGGNNAGITTAIDDNGNSHNGSLMNFALNGPSSNWVGGQTFGPTLTNDAPVTFAIGETTVTWTATDAAGNTATCAQTVTVIDNEVPTITCPSDITNVVATSASGAVVTYTAPVGTDNCTGATTTIVTSPTAGLASGSTFPIGTTTVTYTVTDAANNKAECSFDVTVVGVTPDIVCPANITVENDAGQCGAIVTFAATETVGIPASTITYSHASGSEFPVGTTTVTATATNAVGTDSCTFTITVSDTEDPVLVGVPGDVNSSCDAIPAAAVPTATDNCDNNVAIALNAVSTQDPNAANIGHYNYTITRTWTATDVAGNQDVQSQVITVSDTEDPVLVGVPGDVNSSCDAIPAAAVPTATDNCDNNVAIALNAVSTQDPNAANIGHYNYTITRTWTATDVAGNQDVQSQVITVSDTEAPDLGCLDIELLFENGASSGSITAADILAFATDNCDDDLEVHISQLDFDCGDIGGDLDDLIISEYVDGSFVDDGGLGYSKNCIEIYNGTGLPVNLSDYRLVIYADGSTTPTSIFPLGSTLANEDDDTGQTGVYTFCYTGFNEAPAQASALLDYDGNDAIALVKNGSQVDLIGIIGDNPGLNGWSNGTVSTGSKTLVRKKDALRGSTTNNTIDFLNQWMQYPEDDIVNLGSHEIEIEGFANNVIITVTDASGNSSTCLANVTVIELTPPTAIAQNVEVILDATGNGSTSPQLVDNGSSDNCGIGPLALDNETFTCADIATNPNMVTLTVTDVNGNSSTATAFVTVIDNLEPIVNTDDITIGLGADGTYTLSQANIDALSKINAAQDPTSDNCGIASVTVSPNTFSCSDVGIEGVEVTVTVTDVNNNVNTDTATVFVEDTVDPEAICADITATLVSTGEVIVTGADVGFGSTDSCGIATYEIKRAADGDESFSDSITFYCEDEGANVVTIRVTDVNGNTDLCTANVTVDGNFPEVDITSSDLPEFCQGAVIVLTANSDLAIAYEWFFEGDAIANATNESIEVDKDGEYTVIVTSATNCTAENNFIVSGFDKGGLLSAYTILATEEVFLIGSNIVESGGVGAMLPGSGNVKLHQASTVVDFTQAATISLQQGSDAGDEILSAANPTLPDFMFNTVSNAGSPNAIVTGTQTLSGSVYNIVEVREGAEVTFSSPNVFINELKTWKDSAIEFEGCTNVLINERFQLAQNSTINLDSESKVTFYVNDDVSIEKGSYVRASIYAYNHNITAKGLNGNGKNIDPEPTFMTGLFIANRVQGNKNVVWNADDLCASCPVTYPNARASEPKDVLLGEFDAKGWPSPSDTQFNIKVSTKNKADVVTIEVFDMGNKLVHSKQFNHDDTYRFGEKLEGGVYIVKISQGGSLKILRLIKN